jgi:hypothetical protein
MLPVDVRGCHLLAAEPVEQLLLGAGRRVRQSAVAYPDQAAPIVLPDRGVWGAKEQILWLISGVKPLSGNFWTPLASWIIQFLPESLHLLVKCFAQSLAIPIHLCITHKCLDRNKCSQQESQCGTRTLLEINYIAPGGI